MEVSKLIVLPAIEFQLYDILYYFFYFFFIFNDFIFFPL